jgi:hypothetical protein
VKSVLKQVDERVAKDKGLSKRDLLMQLVQEHPREQIYLDACRAYQHGQGLEAHHQGTTAAARADRR